MKKSSLRLPVYGLAVLLGLAACQTQAPQLSYQESPENGITLDAEVEPAADLQATIAPYKEQLDAQMSELIGGVGVELWKEGQGESPLANFVADLTRQQAADSTGLPIDLGVTNTGGLRVPLQVGPVYLRDVYELMPFDNTLMVLRLSGKQLEELYTRAAAHGNIIFSGNARLEVENDQPKAMLIDGEPIDPAGTYLVATSDYLANGGDNVVVFTEAEIVSRTGILMRDAIAATFRALHKEGKTVNAVVDGRYVNQELKREH